MLVRADKLAEFIDSHNDSIFWDWLAEQSDLFIQIGKCDDPFDAFCDGYSFCQGIDTKDTPHIPVYHYTVGDHDWFKLIFRMSENAALQELDARWKAHLAAKREVGSTKKKRLAKCKLCEERAEWRIYPSKTGVLSCCQECLGEALTVYSSAKVSRIE
jgi:hypothetical protein